MISRAEIKAWAKQRLFTPEQLKRWLWERKGILVLVVAIAIVLIFFWAYIKAIMVMAALILLGFLSLLYNRVIRISLGFELIMLITVLAGVMYGPFAAFFVGATALFAVEVFNQSLQHSTVVSFIGLAVVSFAISYLNEMNISALGIIVTLLYNAVIAPGYLLMGSAPWKTLLFTATDIPFNIWVFLVIAPRLIELLS
jgi:hypothetical protein